MGLKDPAFGPHNAARYAERLANEVKTRPRLADLSPNPLLLTLMASLHRWQEGGSLPERRQELYEQSVKLLIDLWQRPKQLFDAEGNPAGQEYDVFTELGISQDALRGALNWVAYDAHKEQPDLTGTHDIRARVLAGALYEAATDKGKAQGERRIIQYLINRAGLLIEREHGRVYTFPHRTFQEYLAASYLADENYPYLLLERLREEDARWREAALLAAAKAGRSGIWHLAETFCPHDWPPSFATTDSDWYAALRAAQALIEVEPQPLREPSERQHRLVERLRAWLAALAETGCLPAPERAAAGDALARLLHVPPTSSAAGGDPRPGVGVDPKTGIPALQWCYVPPASFLMGSKEYDAEKPQHEQPVPHNYYIARYPVTNAQFRVFVDDPHGYRNGDWWTRAGLSWRGGRTKPEMYGGVYDLPNHPVVMITWYEAVAWCNWLTDKLRMANSGWQIRLPSEAEWEKAARGGLEIPANPIIVNTLPSATPDPKSRIQNPKSTRLYPWGATPELDVPDPNRANYDETGIGATCAVGIFPEGRPPYGCLDMSGNVWEWCATRWVDNYEDYGINEDNTLEGDAHRVVRGGSWNYNRGSARCAYRSGYSPDYRSWSRGFRVVVSPI